MVSAEASLWELGIQLPQASTPFGAYVDAVQTGDLLSLRLAGYFMALLAGCDQSRISTCRA
jgi:hypothetical protein